MAGDTATMLTLHNGKVLLAGGDANGMARLYDPATNTLTTSTMMFAVGNPTATELADGRVLVTGGINSGHVTVRAQVFDPNTLTWSLTGSMHTPRIYHTATRLADGTGMVLIAGGINDGGSPLGSAELYDPTTGTWSTAASMNAARELHTATLLPGSGMVLVMGGLGLSSAELYDPVTMSWSYTGFMSTAREFHTATVLPNGTVLVTGGTSNGTSALATAELYDPASGTWSNTMGMTTARERHTATLINGKVLVAGGTSNGTSALSSAELYDPGSHTWSAAGSLSSARYNHTAAPLGSNRVLIAGGYNGSSFLSSAETYVLNSGLPDHLAMSFNPAARAAGTPFTFTVTVQDADNNTVTGYTGTVHIVVSDGETANISFTSAHMGTRTFSLPGTLLNHAPGYSVTGTDTADMQLTGRTTLTVFAGAADHIRFNEPATVTAGAPFTITVTIVDAYDNRVLFYFGTVHFTATNGAQATYMFSPLDSGQHTFNIPGLPRAGTVGITGTDMAAGISGTTMFTVVPGAADHWVFLQQPTDTMAGHTISPIIVELVDQFNNVETGDDTDIVVLTIGVNPGGGTLSGSQLKQLSGGMATFDDLSINMPGVGYTLSAHGGGVADDDSNPFNITM
jgi:hypothetical protein